ncbi:114_t:CDS:2, partial [Scutellospora calospora]
SAKPLPPVKTAPATKSRPFKLETNARGEKYQQRLRQELVKMKRRDKENHRFHAKPAPKPKFPLTQTKKQSKPLTEPVFYQALRNASSETKLEGLVNTSRVIL